MSYTTEKDGNIANYYGQHLDELRAFAKSRIGNEEAAEDLVQDVFIRLLTSKKMISSVTLPCLVYTSLRNAVCDYWRHRRTIEEFEHYISKTGTAVTDLNAESVYSAYEINRLLENGIARLSKSQQKIYRLNIYEGLKVSEISETLHIDYKCAENGLGAARRTMRNYIRHSLAI